jgi:hypothetical protein
MAPAAAQPCHLEPVEGERRRAFADLKARLAAKPAAPVESLIPTTIPELDRLLDGGFPAGSIATLEGQTGRWSLAAGLVARLTRRSLVAILDDGGLYPPALAEAGAHLERVLIVPARKPLAAIRAADILLRSRICRLVVMPAVAVRDAIWARLAKLARRSGVLLIVIASSAGAALSAVASVRLHCRLEAALVRGRRGLWGTLDGFRLIVDLRKPPYPAVRSACVRVGGEDGDAALR